MYPTPLTSTDVCTAITNRLHVSFFYKNHYRILIPVAHGVQKTTGNRVLRAFQVGGGRNTGETPGWGMFLMEDISDFRVLSDHFDANPPGYRRGDKHIEPIHCQL